MQNLLLFYRQTIAISYFIHLNTQYYINFIIININSRNCVNDLKVFLQLNKDLLLSLFKVSMTLLRMHHCMYNKITQPNQKNKKIV